MLCGIYARKNGDDSDKNEEARSTTRQIERATAYAQSTGWTVDLCTWTTPYPAPSGSTDQVGMR